MLSVELEGSHRKTSRTNPSFSTLLGALWDFSNSIINLSASRRGDSLPSYSLTRPWRATGRNILVHEAPETKCGGFVIVRLHAKKGVHKREAASLFWSSMADFSRNSAPNSYAWRLGSSIPRLGIDSMAGTSMPKPVVDTPRLSVRTGRVTVRVLDTEGH